MPDEARDGDDGIAVRDVRDGDPAVVAALALGWEMADLYAVRELDGPVPELPPTLPGIARMLPRQRVHASLLRIRVLIRRALAAGVAETIRVPSAQILGELPEGDQPAWGQALYDLHVQLVGALRAAGDAPVQAYDVGRSLGEICQDPRDLSALIDRLDVRNVLPIQGRLADLASVLPAHSAAAVSATLEQWQRWTGEARARESMSDVRGALRRQGELWRALLSGDKDARQMIDPDTVVAASVRHASRLGTLIRGLAGAYLPALGLAALATLLLVYAILFHNGIATVLGALGAVAATLIVLRRVVSLTVGNTIDELRDGLWSAELDSAVAQSVLRLPPRTPVATAPPVSPSPSPAPPLVAPRATVPESQTQKVQAEVASRVERALRVTRNAHAQGFHVPASGPASTTPDGPGGEVAPLRASEPSAGRASVDVVAGGAEAPADEAPGHAPGAPGHAPEAPGHAAGAPGPAAGAPGPAPNGAPEGGPGATPGGSAAA
jgi:hypothetical protein